MSVKDDKPQFTIVGAGPGGALMACYLARAGYRVDLYEKRPDPRTHPPERGRSINLALSVRGLHALGEVGLAEEVLRAAIPMGGRLIHPLGADWAFQRYGKDETEALYSVSRAGLNQILINAAARHETVRLFFGKKCAGLDVQDGTLEVLDEATQTAARVPADVVIGADGAFSAVRAQMQKQCRLNYRQDFESHGYKELTIPAGVRGPFELERRALHIWPRQSFMMIALPNVDGSFTCTLFYPWEGPRSFASLKTQFDVRLFFTEQLEDAMVLMPTLLQDFFANPTGALVTVRCSPWHVGGRVVLLGDACHAVIPFLGQGMNAAFEDCTVLAACLGEHAPNWEGAFRAFEARRKPHTDALADLCVANFLEMRDKVGSRLFRLKKKAQLRLHQLFPRSYVPLYNMIQFTRVPYADARKRARTQDRVVQAVGLTLLALLAVLLLLLLR